MLLSSPADAARALPPFARVRALAGSLQKGISSRFLSLRAKVVCLLTLIGAVLIGLSGAYTVYDFRTSLDFKTWSRAAGVGDAIVYAARNAESLSDIAPVIDAVAGAPGLKGAAVTGPDGLIAVSSLPSWIGKPIRIDTPLITTSLSRSRSRSGSAATGNIRATTPSSSISRAWARAP